MDPVQTMMDIMTFMMNGEFGEAEYLMNELKEWHGRGGFLPDRAAMNAAMELRSTYV